MRDDVARWLLCTCVLCSPLNDLKRKHDEDEGGGQDPESKFISNCGVTGDIHQNGLTR